jgi:hypothetical protein
MLDVGDQIPDAAVFTESRERVSLRDLAAEGAVIYLFYLFDC